MIPRKESVEVAAPLCKLDRAWENMACETSSFPRTGVGGGEPLKHKMPIMETLT